MTALKKGDRVRYVGPWCPSWSNRPAILQADTKDRASVQIRFEDDGHTAYPDVCNLELIVEPAFKIGDRVRYVYHAGGHPWNDRVGTVEILIRDRAEVKFDGYPGTFGCTNNNLQPETPALKVGDRVRYVGGAASLKNLVGVLTKIPEAGDSTASVQLDTGGYRYPRFKNLELETPPMTTTDIGLVELKTGDRVRYTGTDRSDWKDKTATILGIATNGTYRVEFDTPWAGSRRGGNSIPRSNLVKLGDLDPTKTLLLLSSLSTPRPEVKLIGTDAEGGLIVNTFGTGKDSHWMIFNPDGTFKSSPNGGGRALKLINQITETIDTTLCDSPIRITTVDGKLTKVDVL